MDKPALSRLAFWALNMTAATGGKNNWPGFIYAETEWARLTRLAAMVDGVAYARYLLIITALKWLALGAMGGSIAHTIRGRKV